MSPTLATNVTVGSDELKNSVSQWQIETKSLTFQATVITTRLLRQLSTVRLPKTMAHIINLRLMCFCVSKFQDETE